MSDAPNWLLPTISILVTVIGVAYMAGRLTGSYTTKDETRALEEKLLSKLEVISKDSAVQHATFVSRKEFEDSEREFKGDIKEIKTTMNQVRDEVLKFVARFGDVKTAKS